MDYIIFEDDARDDIQQLIAARYKYKEHLIWAYGSSSIIQKIKEKGTDNTYYVFVDLVPDNKETYITYNKVRALVKDGYKVIIFPIPCVEYFMILELVANGMIEATSKIKIILDRNIYYNSEWITTDRDKRYIKTFERLCKVAISTLEKQCARKSNGDDRKNNNLKGAYYRGDCPCIHDSCRQESLLDKSLGLLQQYPCIPAYSVHKNTRRLSWEECIAIHRRLVDEYNDMVKRYNKYMELHEECEKNTCKRIAYMY